MAALPPAGLADAIDSLRRGVGDPRLTAVPAHLTLVPPRNLNAAGLAELELHLRRLAHATRPFQIALERAATFWPDSPTLYLSVSDPSGSLAELVASLDAFPGARPREWPFVPHVTLRDGWDPELLSTGVATLSGQLGSWSVDRISLLEQVDSGRSRRWVPVDEYPFGAPVVIGRGGIEVAIVMLGLVPPSCADLLVEPGISQDGRGGLVSGTGSGDAIGGDVERESRRALVAVGTDPGVPDVAVAVAVGTCDAGGARVVSVAVRDGWRGLGIGTRLLDRWCHEARLRGAPIVTVPIAGSAAVVAESCGFSRAGTLLVRQLASVDG